MSSISFDHIPVEIQVEVFSYLDVDDLKSTYCIKPWQDLTRERLVRVVYQKMAFNSMEWNRYFQVNVDGSHYRTLPFDMAKRMFQQCPIFHEKKIMDTHVLMWIPKTINGEAFAINSICELFKDRFPSPTICYYDIWNRILKSYGDIPLNESHWVLLSQNIVPGTVRKSLEEKEQCIAKLANRSGIPYKMPNILDVVTCIFLSHFSSKGTFFDRGCYTLTSCQEPGAIIGAIEESPITKKAYLVTGIVENGALAQWTAVENRE